MFLYFYFYATFIVAETIIWRLVSRFRPGSVLLLYDSGFIYPNFRLSPLTIQNCSISRENEILYSELFYVTLYSWTLKIYWCINMTFIIWMMKYLWNEFKVRSCSFWLLYAHTNCKLQLQTKLGSYFLRHLRLVKQSFAFLLFQPADPNFLPGKKNWRTLIIICYGRNSPSF